MILVERGIKGEESEGHIYRVRSPVNIRAVKSFKENDLARPKAIVVIFISKGYEGRLIKHVDLIHAGLMGRLNTNMKCLNISYANEKIERCSV